jgi:hypothetical protein
VVLAGLAVAAVWVADARRLVPRAASPAPAESLAIAAAARPASASSDHSSP